VTDEERPPLGGQCGGIFARASLFDVLHSSHLQAVGNTRDQIEHWLSYAPEMSAGEGETLPAVIETELIMAGMQGRVVTC